MHDIIVIGASAAVAGIAVHLYKEYAKPSAETIAADFAKARAKVNQTIEGAEALAAKLKATL